MGGVVIVKTPHYVDDRLHMPNLRQKSISEPFTPAGTSNKPGDIYEFYCGGRRLFRIEELRQLRQSPVGQRDHPDVRVYGTESIVLSRD
jgi:hypothetical protein